MKRDGAATLQRYLRLHALVGAGVGGVAGAALAGTDALGLAAMTDGGIDAYLLVPALAGLFAICAAASALDFLPTEGDEPSMPRRVDERRAVRLRVPARG